MNAPDTGDTTRSLYDVVARLAGRVPDDLVALCRDLLAGGAVDDVARALGWAVLTAHAPLTDDDVALLADVLHGDEDEPLVLARPGRDDEPLTPPFVFSSTPPDTGTGAPNDGSAAVARAVRDAARDPGVRGVWVTWRVPAAETPWPPPRLVHLVEVDPDADPVALTGRLQAAAAAAGERDPQVEVFVADTGPTPYQYLAVADAVLVWAREDDRGVRLVPLFDRPDGPEPAFDPDRPRIDDPRERARVLSYLEAGAPLLEADLLADDVLDPARGAVVPLTFRTDGTSVWTDAVAYYLAEHGIAPDPALLGHIRAAGYAPSPVDMVTVHRAVALLVDRDDDLPDPDDDLPDRDDDLPDRDDDLPDPSGDPAVRPYARG